MAKRKKRRKFKRDPLDFIALPKINLEPETKKSILIVLILAFGAISLLSLFDLAGSMGFFLNRGAILLFGWGKLIFPFIFLGLGFFLYNEDKYLLRGSNYLGLFLFILSFHALLHLFIDQSQWQASVSEGAGGGYIGLLVASAFVKIMGFWAGLIVAICLLLISLMLMFDTSLMRLIGNESWLAKLFYPISFAFNKIFKRSEEDSEEEEEENVEESGNAENEEDEEFEDDEEDEELERGKTEDINFHSREIKDAAALAAEIGDRKWKPTNIKIDLPLDLLNGKIGKPTSGDTKANLIIIQKTLENFGIMAEMGAISIGPTVTQYTLKPAEGVKLSRITALSNNLSLALAAHPIRIEAPIPGKALVGIEVPNQAVALVSLKEILSSKEFKARESNLTIAIGKDVSGKPWSANLAKMPHLLVAGSTGSGKSVMLNTIIVSLLYQNNPDDLRLIMVDPKRVELPIYNGIPHLLTPVIIDVDKTINALKFCLNEMDRRFDLLGKAGKRDIASYNSSGREKMPYIVFIVDELADLMVVSAREVEAAIIRLAQMARAVGIHLILSTQRPSVDVITGLIKANITSRIAFSVASNIDSRTILDSQGAEKLLGKGDMLFSSAELSQPKRLQAAYLSDSEIKKVVSFIKREGGGANYDDDVIERQKVHGIAGVGMGEGYNDNLLEEAKEIIINSGKASASYLQRRLQVGYARAARMLDALEEAGVIGPGQGAKQREVLISKEQYESTINQGVSGVSLHNQEEAEAPDDYLGVSEEDEEEDEEDEEDEEEREFDEEKDESSFAKISEDSNGEEEKDKEEEEDEEDKKEETVKEEKKEVEKEKDKDENQNEKKEDDEEDENDGKYFSR
ncbi:DNA translocase FtsK [Candidatus Parcubacteria bacterium]|nr:DNA translocase FtsK [Candidatus Parcubacteria bacterium]